MLAAGYCLGQTADDVVTRSLQARGGVNQFSSILSLRMTGRIRFGTGAFGPITVLAQRPSSFRTEVTIGEDRITQAYDGVTPWQSTAGAHDEAPHILAGPSAAQVLDQAVNAIGGPLVDLKQRGTTVALVGSAIVNGKDCYKLKLTLKTGTVIYQYIEKSSMLEIEEELLIQVQDKPLTIHESVGDYRKFGGVQLPCSFTSHEADGSEGERLEITAVELNPKLDHALFQLPSVKAAKAGSH